MVCTQLGHTNFFPHKIEEGHGKGAGWVFVISTGLEEGGRGRVLEENKI